MTTDTEAKPIATLLVGAEGAAEIEKQPWVRPATDDEKQEFVERICQGDERRYRNALIDGKGRPYFLLTVLDNAPESIQVNAKSFARCFRITD